MNDNATNEPLDSLPDFENCEYSHIKRPASPNLLAWDKARECERRLIWYSWVEARNDQSNPRHLVLLNDSLNAFLLSFEAAIQHAKDQARKFSPKVDLDTWLTKQTENDTLLNGVRTLRLLDAHVQSYPVAAHIIVKIGSSPSSVRRWSLQELRLKDLTKLDSPKLKESDLGAWNSLVQSEDTIALMTGALDRLNTLLLRLEGLA